MYAWSGAPFNMAIVGGWEFLKGRGIPEGPASTLVKPNDKPSLN